MSFQVERSSETAYIFGEEVDAGPQDTIYVADLRTSEIFSFSDSAAVIWCLIEEKISTDELVELVAEVFGESTDTVREGTLAFVENLLAQDLLVRD